MTIEEFDYHNLNNDMPCMWIGQGSGYKDNWDINKYKDIIYIPEFAYEDNLNVKRENAYSVEDFIELCDGDSEKAYQLYIECDWQFPETLLDEWERENV